MIGRVLGIAASAGLRWPRLLLLVVAATTIAATLALRDFRIEPDISRMLPDSREVALFRALEQRTAGGRSLLIVVHGDNLAATEAELRGLAARLRESPFLARVQVERREWLGGAESGVAPNPSDPNAAATEPATGPAPLWALDTSARAVLRERLTTNRRDALQDMLANLAADPLGGQAIALADPLDLRSVLADAATAALPLPLAPGSDLFVFADGRVGVLLAIGKREPYDIEFARDLLADVEPRLSPAQCELWGGYVVAREQATRMQDDMMWATGCASLLVGLYLALVLRNLLAPLLVLLPTALAITWALPLGAALFGAFNVVAVGAAAVLLGLGDDFSMHYFARYGAERAHADHAVATQRTLASVGPPIVLGALTTSAAFLSLALGQFHGLAGFGALLALGIGLAVALTFVLAPALLAWPWLERRLRVPAPRSTAAAVLERVACSRAGLPLALALTAAGVAGFALLGARGVRFDVDADALSPRASVASAQRARVEALVGFSPVPATLLFDPAVAPARLRAGVEALRAEGVLGFVDGPMPFLVDADTRADVASFRAATADFVAATCADLRALECDAAAFEPGLRRFAALLARDPPAMPDRYLVHDGDRARLALYCYPKQSLRSEANWAAFTAAAARAFGAEAEPFGAFSLLGEVRRVLLHDLWVCTLATLVLVLLGAAALMRGHWLGWLAVLPVLVGSGITLGLVVWFDVPLNLANFVAVPFLLGLGIDDGLHLASHYRHGDRSAGPGEVGVAIWRTTITTAMGFGSLMATSSRGLQSLGVIATTGVMACLLVSFLVMVPIVRWVSRPR